MDGACAPGAAEGAALTDADGAVWPLARALAGAVSPDDVAAAVAAYGSDAAAAVFSNIAMIDGRARVRAVHGPTIDASVAARWSEIDLVGDTPLGTAIVDLAPVLLPSLAAIEERYPDLAEDTVAAGLAATASFPLRRSDGSALGAVGFGWREPQAFDPPQCLRLSLIADLAGQALDRALLYAEQVEAAGRIRLLQNLTEHFASAASAQEVAEIAVAEVASLVGASIVNLHRVDGQWIEEVADARLPDRTAGPTRRPFSDRLPWTDAARTARRVVLPTHGDRQGAYPGAPWVEDLVGFGPVVAFPAVVNGSVVATLALVFPLGTELSGDDLTYLATICAQCGQALERVDASESLRATLAGETRRALLAEATSDLALSLSVTDSLQRLARLVIPELADWVIIDVADDMGRPHQVAMLHRDGHHEVIERFSELQLQGLSEQAPIMRVLATGTPILHSETSTRTADAYVTRRELLELCDRLGICSVMYVPMVARGRTLGCLTLVSGVSGRHYDEQDLRFAVGLAQRAALVVDNSSLYEREHHIANVLQESLLPKVPLIPGLDIAARYRPGDTYTQVGGDFYDVMALPDGSVALMLGDVMGHDLVAAAAMGQLRGHLRACAWEAAVDGAEDPGAVLDRTDSLVQGLDLTEMATVFYGRIERQIERPSGSGTIWGLRYATAGHPLPLVRWPDGPTTLLQGEGVAIGVSAGIQRVPCAVTVPAGSLLVAFSDGLVERRTRDWGDGLDAVRRAVDGAPRDVATAELANRLLDVVGDERSDDTVVLVVRFT